ncbi:uncharacterized protein LOC144159546 [Haemaphysalis longicornis]
MAMGVATLLRVSLLMVTCAVWVIAEAPAEEDVIPEWLFANSGEDEEEATNILISTPKPKPGWVKGGTSCLNTDECGQGKCCLRRYKSPRRRCRRLQRVGEPCTEEQMMGGYYYGHCPCNKNGVCTYTAKGLRCVRKKKEQKPEQPPPQVPTQSPSLPPRLPPKQESQESEEVQGKRPGQAKPSEGENELPELAFENLRGPGENNAISPFLPSRTGNRPTSPSTKPDASSLLGLGQGGNEITPEGGTPTQGGIGVPEQLAHAPNTPQGSNPLPSINRASVPSSASSPAIPGNFLQPGNPPQSHLPQVPDQQPLPTPPSPLPTQTDNGLPPIAEEGPPPPPLPPSPLEAGLPTASK